LQRGVDDGVRLEVGDGPPEATRPRERREVLPGEVEQRVALRDDVGARVGLRLEAVRLALCEEEAAEAGP
jgi:hypothetical protein